MLVALAGIVAVAHAVETALGFGATVIALGVAVHLLPVPELLPPLLALGCLQSAWLAVRGRSVVAWRVLLVRVLPAAAAGVAAGAMLRARASHELLEQLLGAAVIVAALLALRRQTSRSSNDGLGVGLVAAGGVFHGMLASGGPLIVLALGRWLTDKAAFRATLAVLWLSLNVALLSHAALAGDVGAAALERTAALIPGLAIGVAAGEWLHAKLPAETFRRAVVALLAAIGVGLLA
jgi:uncharacterized protein